MGEEQVKSTMQGIASFVTISKRPLYLGKGEPIRSARHSLNLLEVVPYSVTSPVSGH